MRELRGLKALVHDAVDGATLLVGEGQASVGRRAVQVGGAVGLGAEVQAVEAARAAVSELSLATVRLVNRAVQQVSDALIEGLAGEGSVAAPVALRSDALVTPRGAADALVGVVNGVVGDRLHAAGNGLAVEIALRHGAEWLRLERTSLTEQVPTAGSRLVVLVHGLSATETSWCLDAERALGSADAHYGALLERDLGCSALYVRYNSGLPLTRCAASLAEAMRSLCAAWPVPVEELVLVGHSMGGLVCRAAVERAVAEEQAWVGKLSRLVAIGSPHQGAPLARGADAAARWLVGVDLPGTLVTGKLLELRSLGIRDLERGVSGAEAPLLPRVRYAFFAGSLSHTVNPVTKLLGDLLVTVRSAEGPAEASDASVHRARFPGVPHHALQANAAVYEELRAFLAGERDAVPAR